MPARPGWRNQLLVPVVRVYARRFDWDEAQRQYANGVPQREIARRLGVSVAAIRRVCIPAEAARMNAASAEWLKHGRCNACGGPCSRHRGKAFDPGRRCRTCASLGQTNVRDGEALCSTCKAWKPLRAFSPSRSRPIRGVHGECRACQTIRKREWRARRANASRPGQ